MNPPEAWVICVSIVCFTVLLILGGWVALNLWVSRGSDE